MSQGKINQPSKKRTDEVDYTVYGYGSNLNHLFSKEQILAILLTLLIIVGGITIFIQAGKMAAMSQDIEKLTQNLQDKEGKIKEQEMKIKELELIIKQQKNSSKIIPNQ